MAGHYLATYLNDHLAGSEIALELLGHMERAHAGTALADFAAALRGEIAADRGELEALMARLGVAQSLIRKAAVWLSEKGVRLKLLLDDTAGGPLRLLETLDTVSSGIEGKRLLWRALAAAAEAAPQLAGVDYARLERRAEEQRRCAEAVRLEAARWALAPARGARPQETTGSTPP